MRTRLNGAARPALRCGAALAALCALGIACAAARREPEAASAASSRPEPARRPDLVVLLSDDQGYGDLARRGSPARTPRLDAFFAESLELTHLYVSPVCTPTRAALLTGRSPMELGLQYHVLRGWSPQGLAAEVVTLPELLRRADYQTALVGKWHLGHAHPSYQPNAQGFDRFYGHLLGASHFDLDFLGARDLQRDGGRTRDEGYATELLGDELLRVLEERDPTRPLFLLAAFGAPHRPYEAPEALTASYPPLGSQRRRYAAMLESLDAQVGRVLDAVSAGGRDTLVLFLSDNGAVTPPGSNAPLRGGKGTLYEGGIRVPAAIRWPGRLPAGRASAQLLRDSDLYATLAAAAGLPAAELPPRVEGRDLLPALASGELVAHAPLLFAVESNRAQSHAVIDWPFKLVLDEPRAPAQAKPAGAPARRRGGGRRIELFDLASDPGEKRDLRASELARIPPLLARLEAWRATHPGAGLRYDPHPPRGWRRPRDWTEPVSN